MNCALCLVLTACSIQLGEAPSTQPTVAAPRATATPSLGGGSPETPSAPSWAHLGLTGKLFFTQGQQGVFQLELASGAMKRVFQAPTKAWLAAAALAPDGKTFALSYAEAPTDGRPQLGYTDLYEMPVDGSAAPKVLLARAKRTESYFSPHWSVDGAYVYYAHFYPTENASFKYQIERLKYPAGTPEIILENAFWPALAPDGQSLAYVSVDPDTYRNELFIADIDGKNPRRVLPAGSFDAVDAVLFSKDSQTLLFSAVGEGPTGVTPASALSWLDDLFGVRPAAAAPAFHSVPSDWWSVSVNGGTPKRVTKIYDTGLYATNDPKGQYVAFVGSTGLYVMHPDGSGLEKLVKDVSGAGTLDWAP